MAELWFRQGINLDEPDEYVLAVVVDPDGGPADRAVAAVGLYSHEGDRVTYLLRTDGWAEQSLVGDVLTVDVVVYPNVLHGLPVDDAGFDERSPIEPDAIRLLRVSAVVDTAEYQRSPQQVAVLEAPSGTTFERMSAMISADEVWPMVLAPPPGHDPE